MGIRTAQRRLGPVLGLAAFLGLVLTFASSPAAAQQWTPEQRAACEPDAMRLCNQYVPDVQRVSACMSHYRRYLSPACRAAASRRGRAPIDTAIRRSRYVRTSRRAGCRPLCSPPDPAAKSGSSL